MNKLGNIIIVVVVRDVKERRGEKIGKQKKDGKNEGRRKLFQCVLSSSGISFFSKMSFFTPRIN